MLLSLNCDLRQTHHRMIPFAQGLLVYRHYRAGLNMIPLLEQYRAYPDDYFLLPIAMGALAGQLTNIDGVTGATSMGFHSFPFVLEHDPRSGDYGLGFFGHTYESGAYLVRHPDAAVGFVCFLCNLLNVSGTTAATFAPTDAYRSRVYVEPLGLHLVAQAGFFAQVALDLGAATCVVTFQPVASWPPSTELEAGPAYSFIRMQLKKTTSDSIRPGSSFQVVDSGSGQVAPLVRNAYQISPPTGTTGAAQVIISWSA